MKRIQKILAQLDTIAEVLETDDKLYGNWDVQVFIDRVQIGDDNSNILFEGSVEDAEQFLKEQLANAKLCSSVLLNNDYTATVTTEAVIVGCQQFSHNAILNLADAVKKVLG